MTLVELFTTFGGRIGRGGFAAGAGVLFVLSLPIMWLIGNPTAASDVTLGHVIVAIAFMFPHWALAVKRAHDLGKSGWWLFGWSAASVLSIAFSGASTIAATGGSLGVALVLVVLSAIGSLGALYQIGVKLFFFAGTPGHNDYGPPSRLLQTLLNDEQRLPDAVSAPQPQSLRSAVSRVPVVDHNMAAASPKVLSPRQPRQPAATQGGFGRRNGMRPA